MSKANSTLYLLEGFALDVQSRRLAAPNDVVSRLSKREFRLLCVLLARPKQVLSRDTLLDATCGAETEAFDRTIDVQIGRLRRRLQAGTDRQLILTHRGLGYLLDAVVTVS